jgi:thiol-disulfide isomerase/thioredoxin
MMPRLAILVGLIAGIVVAALILGGIYALAPESPTSIPATTAAPEISSAPASAQPTPGGSSAASAPPPSSPGSALFHIGEPAPALVVRQVGGGTIDLASLKGKPVWVNFMATYCPPCQDEFPLMNGFALRYAKDDLAVVAIDVKEDEGTVAAFADSLAARFPMGLDTTGAVATAWDALVLPVHFWIDRDGIVRDGALGGIGPDIMARGLQTILPGATVTP